MALFWSKTEILGQFRVFLFCRLAPEIESSFNALWAPHTTLRVTYALKSPRAKG